MIKNYVFCHKFSHKTQYCRTVTNISARKNILRKEKRCFLCLKPGHLIKDCYAKMRCIKCQNKHHISICNGKEEHEENSENQRGSISVNLAENKNGLYSVLLQTAQAEVISGNTSAKCRILFDSGSQMSYVTPRIKALLNLTPSGRTEMSIKTFGGGRQTKHWIMFSWQLNQNMEIIFRSMPLFPKYLIRCMANMSSMQEKSIII